MTLQPTDWSFLIFSLKLDLKPFFFLAFWPKEQGIHMRKLLFLPVAVNGYQFKSFTYIVERSDY